MFIKVSFYFDNETKAQSERENSLQEIKRKIFRKLEELPPHKQTTYKKKV